jgi:feruloyl-CoA synthase
MRPVKFGPTAVEVARGEGGVLYVRSPERPAPHAARITDKFDEWAGKTPDRVFIADRGPDGAWRKITYAEAREKGRSIAQAILNLGLSLDRPIALLALNNLEHGLIALGALYAGVPYAPVTPAYALLSTDFAKLKHVIGLIEPGLIYVPDPAPFERALDAIVRPNMVVVAGRNAAAREGAIPFDTFAANPTAGVAAATEAVKPDSIVKFLFTSGSTGMPKAVINTMNMWCADQVMLRTSLAFLQDEPPVLVDWLPWNHTAGSNHNYGLTIYNGGTLYIDDGTPTPAGIDKTVRNLMEIAPTLYFNVPKGFEMLCDHFERNEALRKNFFSRVKVLQYSGAGMNQHTWNRLRDIGVATCGERIRMITGYGATETGPFAFGPNHVVERPGMVGIPAVGLEVKLVPHGGKMEVRLRGANITRGYWRQPEKTKEAFDEEGFYKMGDALKFADESDPEQGFVFDGRVTEDFKLSTGTWVDMAGMRAKVIAACAPYIRDVVLAGLDRNYIAALLVPDVAACRDLCKDLAPDANDAAVAAHPALRRHIQDALAEHARKATGSSNRVERATILVEPPTLDTQEMTEKGSLNQIAILARRKPLVEELYAEPPPKHVIVAREMAAG